MSIDNADRTAPAQFNEHEALDVSRRIERDVGSTYRINGREVRARDVHILFADASTGSRSPALVHQGRIGEIIQAKPEQRRRVLEDAAGVAGLHARRHEAELRLKAAEANLTRVEDVIGQLASQIDGLKKQARQAIRYREVAAKVRKAEALLFHLRWIEAQAGVSETTQVHDLSVREMAERTREQAEAAPPQFDRRETKSKGHKRAQHSTVDERAHLEAGAHDLLAHFDKADAERERTHERFLAVYRQVHEMIRDEVAISLKRAR